MSGHKLPVSLLPCYWSLAVDMALSVVVMTVLAAAQMAVAKDYINRARLTELFGFTTPIRLALIVDRAVHGSWPALEAEPPVSSSNNVRIERLMASDGHFNFVFRFPGDDPKAPEQLHNLSFRRNSVPGSAVVFWTCGYQAVAPERDLGIPDLTDLPVAYLATQCRATAPAAGEPR